MELIDRIENCIRAYGPITDEQISEALTVPVGEVRRERLLLEADDRIVPFQVRKHVANDQGRAMRWITAPSSLADREKRDGVSGA